MESSPLPMKGCKILANAQNLYPDTPVMTGVLGFSAYKGPQGVMRTCSNLYLYHAQTDDTYGTNYFYTDMQQQKYKTVICKPILHKTRKNIRNFQ